MQRGYVVILPALTYLFTYSQAFRNLFLPPTCLNVTGTLTRDIQAWQMKMTITLDIAKMTIARVQVNVVTLPAVIYLFTYSQVFRSRFLPQRVYMLRVT